MSLNNYEDRFGYLVIKFFAAVKIDGVFPALNKALAVALKSPCGADLFETIKIAVIGFIYKHKKKSGHAKSSGVIAVQPGVLGDSVLVVGGIMQFYEYCKGCGITITCICREDTRKLYEEYALLADMNYLTFRTPLIASDLKSILKEIRKNKYTYAFCGNNFLHNFFYNAIDASVFIARADSVGAESKSHPEQSVNKELFLPECYKRFFVEMGVPDYPTQQVVLRRVRRHDVDPYILICPEASIRARSLEPDTVKDIIQYLKANARLRIIVSLNGDKKEYLKQIKEIAGRYSDIEIRFGTDLDEFAALLQNSSCLIACDSGSAHFAAAFGIPAVVLCGQQDTGIFFPYSFDIKTDIEPVCVYCEQLSCRNCSTHGWYVKNDRCKASVEAGMSQYCINRIPIKEVYSAIDRVLERCAGNDF